MKMTAETNGPGREPVAWIDPDYVMGQPYGKMTSPVTTYPIRDWTPLYAAPPAAPCIVCGASALVRCDSALCPQNSIAASSGTTEGVQHDNESDGRRTRRVAGEGHASDAQSNRGGDDIDGNDGGAEHSAGLLRPLAHADHGEGNATRAFPLLIDNETLRQKIAADPDDSEPSAGSVAQGEPAPDAAWPTCNCSVSQGKIGNHDGWCNLSRRAAQDEAAKCGQQLAKALTAPAPDADALAVEAWMVEWRRRPHSDLPLVELTRDCPSPSVQRDAASITPLCSIEDARALIEQQARELAALKKHLAEREAYWNP